MVGLLSGGARLLTLTGPGGCGKTRIALAAAAELGDAYPDGVYFVSLDGVEDADAMAGVVADTLDAPPGLSTRERLAQQLADRRLLLVLDNLEQIDGAGSTDEHAGFRPSEGITLRGGAAGRGRRSPEALRAGRPSNGACRRGGPRGPRRCAR